MHYRFSDRLLQTSGAWRSQSESYNHLIRDDDDLHRTCHYTIMNPVNAGLSTQPEGWQWSSACEKPNEKG
jgi:REP element-mobilizing transposase RayT